MLPVPPQIDPEFDLEGVRIELQVAETLAARVRRAGSWALGGVALALMGAGTAYFGLVAAWLGMACLVGIVLLVRSGSEPRQVVLDIERGRLHVEDGDERRTVHLSAFSAARWDCTRPTTRLVLARPDGSEDVVVHVLRRGLGTPGVTRKQREWIVRLLALQLDGDAADDVPDALKNLAMQQRES